MEKAVISTTLAALGPNSGPPYDEKYWGTKSSSPTVAQSHLPNLRDALHLKSTQEGKNPYSTNLTNEASYIVTNYLLATPSKIKGMFLKNLRIFYFRKNPV